MGLLLQIVGLICVIVSLVINISAIISKGSNGLGIALMVIGVMLIGWGRKM